MKFYGASNEREAIEQALNDEFWEDEAYELTNILKVIDQKEKRISFVNGWTGYKEGAPSDVKTIYPYPYGYEVLKSSINDNGWIYKNKYIDLYVEDAGTGYRIGLL